MADLEDMAEALAVFEVHVGFPDQRVELARRLLHEAVSVDDVELLGDHCRGTVDGGPAAAARVLVSLLVDVGKRTARLADLRVVRDAQARRLADRNRAPGDAPAEVAPLPGEPREVWDHDRQCRVAWCRVSGDHRSEAEVAAELGVKPGTLTAMLARGEALCRSPIVEGRRPSLTLSGPGDDAKERAEVRDRVNGFRERMRTDARKPKRRDPNAIDWARLQREMGDLLAGVRRDGVVDLRAVLRDRTRLGALATLEADGFLARAGEPDARGVQPYRVAQNDAERAAFRAAMRAANQAGEQRGRVRAEEVSA